MTFSRAEMDTPFGVDAAGATTTRSAMTESYPGTTFSQADLYLLRHRLCLFHNLCTNYREDMHAHLSLLQDAQPYSGRVKMESLGPLYSEDYGRMIEMTQIDGSDAAAGFLIREARARSGRDALLQDGMGRLAEQLVEMAGVSVVLMPLEQFQQSATFLATFTLDGLTSMMNNFYAGAATLYLYQAWEDAYGDELYNPNFSAAEQKDQTARILADLQEVIDLIETDSGFSTFSYSADPAANTAAWSTLETKLTALRGPLDTLDVKASATRTRLGYGWVVQWVYSALSTAGLEPLDDAGDVNGDGVSDMLGDGLLLGWRMELDALRDAIALQEELINEVTVPQTESLVFWDPAPDSSVDHYPLDTMADRPPVSIALPAVPDWTVGPGGCDFTTIQAAIDTAAPGDAILVQAKTGGAYYEESVQIDKDGITLYADGNNQAFIGQPDGEPFQRYGITITADNVSVCNLMINRAVQGIVVEGTHNVTAVSNTVQWVCDGIVLDGCHGSTFAGNLVADAALHAVNVEQGSQNQFYANAFCLVDGAGDTTPGYDAGNNRWDDGSSVGNYWSDHNGGTSYAIAAGRELDDRVYGAECVTPGLTLTLKTFISGVLGDDSASVDFYYGEPDNGGVKLNTAPIVAQPHGNTAVATYTWDTTGFLGKQDVYAKLCDTAESVTAAVCVFPTRTWAVTSPAYVSTLPLAAGDAVTIVADIDWVSSPYAPAAITVPGGASLALSDMSFSGRDTFMIDVADGASASADNVTWNGAVTLTFAGTCLSGPDVSTAAGPGFKIGNTVLEMEGWDAVDWFDLVFSGRSLMLADMGSVSLSNLTADVLSLVDCTFSSTPGQIDACTIPRMTVRDCAHLKISSNTFTAPDSQLNFQNAVDDIRINGNTFQNVTNPPISGTGCLATDIEFYDNDFNGCAGGIDLSLAADSEGLRFSENTFAELGGTAVQLAAGSLLASPELLFWKNSFSNDTPQSVKGIHLVRMGGGSIDENLFYGVADGVHLEDCEAVSLSLNQFLSGSGGIDSAGVGTNLWDRDYSGNYWAGFSPDAPPSPYNPAAYAEAYTNTAGVVDRYPLMNESDQPGLRSVPAVEYVAPGDPCVGLAWPEPRFVQMANTEAILDRLTGLTWFWQGNAIGDEHPAYDNDGAAGDGFVTWTHALAFVDGVNDGTYADVSAGHTDWRMPNIRELATLLNAGATVANQLNGAGFYHVQNADYWSSTSDYWDDDEYAWVLNCGSGAEITLADKTGTAGLLMVRGGSNDGSADLTYAAAPSATGQTISYAGRDDGDLERGVQPPPDRFINNGDGTVTDKLTGLTWWTKTLTYGRTWQEALDDVDDLNVGGRFPDGYDKGFHDWRLPNMNELHTIFKYWNLSDYYLPDIFQQNYFMQPLWASTTHPDDSTLAYAVDFMWGGLFGAAKASGYRVLPVRGGQVASTNSAGFYLAGDWVEEYGTCPNGSANRHTLTIGNGGDAGRVMTAYINGIDADQFCLRGVMAGDLFASGETRDFHVDFLPATPGEKHADLVVITEDSVRPRLIKHLTGVSYQNTLNIVIAGNGSGVIRMQPWNRPMIELTAGTNVLFNPGLGIDLYAEPAPHSHISGWSAFSGTTITQQNDTNVYVQLDEDCSVTCTFELDTVVVTAAVDTAGGVVSSPGITTYNYGDSPAYTFSADPEYYLSDVRLDGVSVGAPSNYVFDPLIQSHELTASFELIKHTITASAGSGGNIRPFGELGQDAATERVYTITPDTGYFISDVLVDDVSVGAVSNFTLSYPTEDYTIQAQFAANEFDVTVITTGQGTTDPSGPLQMTINDSQNISCLPAENWFVSNVLIGSESLGSVSNFMISGVTSDITVEVIFDTDCYAIEAMCGVGGTIWPYGSTYVPPDGSRLFVLTPDDAHRIDDLVVDGISCGATNRYTFSHVDGAHTITAVFTDHDPIPVSLPRTGADVSYSSGDDGDVQAGIEWPEPRFSDNGDGTLTDHLTGLIWLKDNAVLGTGSWGEALDAIENLNTNSQEVAPAGYTEIFPDWRLPNCNELSSLLMHAGSTNILNWLESQGITLGALNIWSSTTSERLVSSAWGCSMESGGYLSQLAGKTSDFAVMAVRGTSTGPYVVPQTGQTTAYAEGDDGTLQRGAAWPTNRFVLHDDHTATDQLTGLMWIPSGDLFYEYQPAQGHTATWNQALDLRNAVNSGLLAAELTGYGDWQLPNLRQLQSLLDLSRNQPAFPTNHPFAGFPDTLADSRVISSTLHPQDTNQRGCLSAYDGTLGYFTPEYESRVLLVRDASKVNIWATSSAGGSISPMGTNRVDVGTNITFTIVPDTGQQITDVLVDDYSVGAVDTYTFTNVNQPRSIEAQFEPLSYTVTVSCGSGGSVSPAGTRSVDFGESLRLAFTPNDEFAVAGVTKNGVAVDAPFFLQLDNVTNDCTISVTFESIAGEKMPVAATGQTNSYAADDDGDEQSGEPWPDPRFVDNGDGTITDNLTGLMWLKEANLGTLENGWQHSWSEALDEVAAFNADPSFFDRTDYTADYTDWRMPNIVELSSIMMQCGEADLQATLSNAGFVGFGINEQYWSSTSLQLGPTSYGYYVRTDSSQGMEIDYGAKTQGFFTWPVRGTASGPVPLPETGQTTSVATGDDADLDRGIAWPSPRFVDNGDGTVTDELTGLIWFQNANLCDGKLSWADALSYVQDLNTGTESGNCGFSDWRLPNLNELMSLIDWIEYYPALPSGQLFTQFQNGRYWSSSSVNSNNAYAVDFRDADVANFLSKNESTLCYLLPVRGVAGFSSAASYEQWINSNLAGYSDSQKTYDADPDNDGVPNLLEYAVGGDPGLADPDAGRPEWVVTNGTPVCAVYLHRTAEDVQYRVKTSTNLFNWESAELIFSNGTWLVEPTGLNVFNALPMDEKISRLLLNDPESPDCLFLYLEVSKGE